MSEKLTGGLKGNFSRFLPDSGLVLEGGNISGSNLFDLKVNGISKFVVDKNGNISLDGSKNSANQLYSYIGFDPNNGAGFIIGSQAAGAVALAVPYGYTAVKIASGVPFGFANTSNASTGTQDVFLTRRGIGNLRLGNFDAAAPVAQILSVQSVVAGTTDTAGVDLTITGSQGTGTGAGGKILFQVAPASTTGNTQNALVTALTITPTTNIGIGTSSPADKLQIEGNLYFGTNPRTIYSGGTANLSIQVNTGSIFFLRNNGSSESMRIDASGNLGVGTSSPSQKLQVQGTGYATGDFRAPIFYDSANTSFYADLNSNSHLNTLNADNIGWNSLVGLFGQRTIAINELTDVLYQADKRFTVTNGAASYFNGNFDDGVTIPINTTRVITINMNGQSGIPAGGITYSSGYIYVSFYYTSCLYSSISLRTQHSGVWYTASAPTDISTNSSFKVLQFAVPQGNYLTDIELTITTDATNAVQVTGINYYATRWTTELEFPYASKYLNSNFFFGNFGVKTDTGANNNLLSGTGSSFFNLTNGNTGIGNSAPNAKLQVTGTANVSGNVVIGGFTTLSTNTLTVGTGSYFIANGNVGVGTSSPSYTLQVNGSFAATTKSFVIDHPTKKGKKLRYGSLEGPENGVYVRGRTTNNVIELPDYWYKLIDKDSITVSLTPINKTTQPSIGKITNKKVYIIGDDIDCFYHIFAERKDVEKLQVEI